MSDNSLFLEGVIGRALKKLNGKKRRKALADKLDQKLDDMQRAKGITPGKLSVGDHKTLGKDAVYGKNVKRLNSVKYGDDVVWRKNKYLTGKKQLREFTEPLRQVMPETLENFLHHISSPISHNASLNEVTVLDNKKTPLAARQGKLTRSNAMIEQGNKELGNENLHKKMAEGFKSSFSQMETEDHATRRAKLKESRGVFDSFAQSRGFKKAPSLFNENGKTKKSTGEGVHTIGLALAPHTAHGLSHFDVCPRASSECRANCLGTEAGGNRQFPDAALSSKILKTHFIAKHPEHAARIMHHEISQHTKQAQKAGYIPGVRLNVTSDIAWEKFGKKMITDHPHTQFYDYTKMHNRVLGQDREDHPSNYHLTLSHTGTDHPESNDTHAVHALNNGHVVAMVYQRGKNVPKPTHVEDVKSGKRWKIVGGDEDDNTFNRHEQAGVHPGHEGIVSGLQLKGVKNESAGHFANKVDTDGVIRIGKK